MGATRRKPAARLRAATAGRADRAEVDGGGRQVGADCVEPGPEPAAGPHFAANATTHQEKPLPAPPAEFDSVALPQPLHHLPGAQQHDGVGRKGFALFAGSSYRHIGNILQCVLA